MASTIKQALKILRIKQVCERVGICKSHIYKMMHDGKFPASIKLGERSTGWFEHEIDNWLINRSSSPE